LLNGDEAHEKRLTERRLAGICKGDDELRFTHDPFARRFRDADGRACMALVAGHFPRGGARPSMVKRTS
jgi:hypothetical protein